MTATRRPSPPPPAPAPSRLTSLFFALGCVAVLAVTFALGVAAGRRWPSGLPLPGLGISPAATAATPAAPPPAKADREVARRAESRGLDKGKASTDAAPVLTFYHELTAPLASTPPLTRPAAAKRDPKPTEPARPAAAEVTKPAPRTVDPIKLATSEAALAEPPSRGAMAAASPATPSGASERPSGASERPSGASERPAGPTFTVQVGAFKARAQAEALRGRLAETGREVEVTEAEAGGVTQYRVRVGTFATRAAARDAAARLGAERQIATYVTTR